jgi:hypothetical protein
MAKARDVGNFGSLGAKLKNRIVWRSWGKDKTGKNHFGYTAPGPIFGQYFDPGGYEGVAEKFVNGTVQMPDSDECYPPKDIMGCVYRFNKASMDQERAIELRDQFIDDYEKALTLARTIQWDETEVWELFRFAEFGRESAKGQNYGPINGNYRYLLQCGYDAGVNLQLIQKVKETWKNDKPSGEYAPMGFKEANYIVQANLEHSWSKADGFGIEVVNCRQNMALAGDQFFNMDFSTFAQMVYPDSAPEDWQ